MDKKRILLLEPDEEQGELLANWLKDENYEVKLVEDAKEVLPVLSNEKFDSIIIDIETIEDVLELCHELEKDQRFSNISVFVLIYKTRIKEIALLMDVGVEGLLFKPFEIDDFSKRLKALVREAESIKRGKKLLDKNYINVFLELSSHASHEDFFLLVPILFEKLILAKINMIVGDPIIIQIIKRCNEVIGEDYAFIREVKFSNTKFLLDGVEKAAKDVPIEKLTIAFRDYIYAFLQMVQTLTSDILMDYCALTETRKE